MKKTFSIIAFLLFVIVVCQAQTTKADPIVMLRSTGQAANRLLITDGSGNVNWGAINTIISGGTGISVNASGVINNTAPDQTVSLVGAGISVVSGTYPNFTVTSTEADGSITNELQQITTTTSRVTTLSNGGGSFTINGTGGTTVTASTSGVYTINSPTRLYGSRIDYVTTSAIAQGGTFTTTGITLPTSTSSFMVIADGMVLNGRSNGSDTIWDYDRTGTSQLTFNRPLSQGTTILIFY